jgi:hypothetical protein
MGSWEPDSTILAEGEVSGYSWVVPAKVEGRWVFTGIPNWSTAQVKLTQKSQKFDGDVSMNQTLSQRIEGHLRGAQISFNFHDGDAQPKTFVGIVSANKMHGTIKEMPGSVVTATRVQ